MNKIVDGKLEKFYSTVCLLEQGFIKNPDQTIKELVARKLPNWAKTSSFAVSPAIWLAKRWRMMLRPRRRWRSGFLRGSRHLCTRSMIADAAAFLASALTQRRYRRPGRMIDKSVSPASSVVKVERQWG